MNKEDIVTIPKENLKSKQLKMSLIFDFIGMLSYIFPLIAEKTDVIWAPIAGILLFKMYKGNVGKAAGIIVFLEELLPFSDFIPTFTITWFYTYIIQGKKNP